MNSSPSLPLLVVDGYNVIAAEPSLRSRFGDDPDSVRLELIERVASFATGMYEALVVFDAQRNPSSDGTPHDVAGVTVVFSPAGVEADAVIEAWSHAALESGRQVVLATSDAETQRVVGRSGVTRLSSRLFWDEIRDADAEAAEHKPEATRTRIEDVIDEETREALMRWARGG